MTNSRAYHQPTPLIFSFLVFSECQMLYDWDYDEAANTNSGFQVSEYSQLTFLIVNPSSHQPVVFVVVLVVALLPLIIIIIIFVG